MSKELPIHPFSGLTAVGFRKNGMPIFPIKGASDDGAPTGEENPPKDDGGQEKQTEPKTFTQADIDRIVNDRLARESRKFSDYEDLKAKASRLEDLESASATDLEKAVKTAKEETMAEIAAQYGERLARETLKAQLKAGGIKPEDIDVLIEDYNLGKYVEKDGSVDQEGLERIAARHTAVQKPDLGQGGRGGEAKSKSLNEALSKHYSKP